MAATEPRICGYPSIVNDVQKPKRRRGVLLSLSLLIVVAGIGAAAVKLKGGREPGHPLSAGERKTLDADAAYMNAHGLNHFGALAKQLADSGIWMDANDGDRYLRGAEQNGDTPYAYTLSGGKHPSAIVLAPRFFAENLSDASRASLMIHEMGHYEAYVATGKSDEYDGYKTQYDTSAKLGLTEADGITYFMMLDGVEQYVVPRDASYAQKPNVKEYIEQSKP